MLMRTPKTKVQDFAALLKIPPKPAALVRAELDWRRARADREAAQARHVEAVNLLRAQVPGQPLTITVHETEELAAAIGPLLEAEREASESRAKLRQEYEATTAAALTDALEQLRNAIGDQINALEELLAHGNEVHASSVAAGIKLRSNLPAWCRNALGTAIAPLRRSLRGRS